MSSLPSTLPLFSLFQPNKEKAPPRGAVSWRSHSFVLIVVAATIYVGVRLFEVGAWLPTRDADVASAGVVHLVSVSDEPIKEAGARPFFIANPLPIVIAEGLVSASYERPLFAYIQKPLSVRNEGPAFAYSSGTRIGSKSRRINGHYHAIDVSGLFTDIANDKLHLKARLLSEHVQSTNVQDRLLTFGQIPLRYGDSAKRQERGERAQEEREEQAYRLYDAPLRVGLRSICSAPLLAQVGVIMVLGMLAALLVVSAVWSLPRRALFAALLLALACGCGAVALGVGLTCAEQYASADNR